LLGWTGPTFAQRAIAPPRHAAPTLALASHRATYTVSLVRASQRDGVRTASGSTTYTLTDRCDGYTIESGLHLELGMSDGSDSVIEQKYAAWEAKDNRSASFRMLTHENGELKDSYHGTVTLDAAGAGTVTYAGEQPTTYTLPAGTLLTTSHLIALLKGSERGDRILNRSVFDGSFDDGPYRITAVIGPAVRGIRPVSDTLEMGTPVTLALAYFSLQTPADEPEYELTMTVYPNGVARHMVQDFGGFTLAFDLTQAEPITAVSCQ
jgi:hypothetical protein